VTLNLQPATTAAAAQLQRIAADAHATLAVIADALRRLEDGTAGYPTTPGTGPAAAIPTPVQRPDGRTSCPVRGCGAVTDDYHGHWHDQHAPTTSTQPERMALAGTDEAETDTTTLIRELRRAGTSMLTVRRTAEKWGVTKIGAKTTTTPRDDAWCTSCRRANHFTPRRPEGGPDCRWCADTLRNLNSVLANLGLPPVTVIPIAAVEKHAAGRRVTAADLEGWAKAPTQPRRRSPRTQRAATRALRTGRTEP
jgi:hypothetical protein